MVQLRRVAQPAQMAEIQCSALLLLTAEAEEVLTPAPAVGYPMEEAAGLVAELELEIAEVTLVEMGILLRLHQVKEIQAELGLVVL